jgi:hypothetical protein
MAVASSNIDVLQCVRTQNGWLYAQGDQLVVKTGFWDKFWVVIEDLRSLFQFVPLSDWENFYQILAKEKALDTS